MDNGLSSLVAGKRRRDGYANEEDVKDVKASRQWYGSQRGDKEQGQQQQLSNGHYQGVSVENHIRMQQQKQLLSEATPTLPGVPSLNMEQRVMAAAALQDLRGITESSKAFFQSQLQQQQQQQPQQQHTKYGVVQQQALPQLLNSDTTTLGESSSTGQPPQTGPLPLPPLPYIRTPPLHSEADTHNGSPSSSSSGPYPNLPNTMPASQYGLSHRSNVPIQQQQQQQQQQQLPELETESSYSSLMHPSQSKLLAQSQSGLTQHLQQQQQQQQQQQPDRESIMHSSGLVVSYQRDEFPHGQVVQSLGLPQNGNVHQLSGHPSRNLVQNGAAFHHGGHTLPANTFQNGSQNGSQTGMQNGMQNGLQNGMQNGLQNGMQNGLQNGMQNGNIQQPGGQVLPNGNQLPQGDSQRLVSNVLHQQGRNPMASSSHHQQGVHSSQIGLPNGVMHQQQQGGHRMQESMVQYQSGQMAPQQPSHCSSNGAAGAHPSVQGCSSSFQHQEAGFSPLHGDFHQVPNSWYPSMRDSSTISETQPSVSTARLLLPPSVPDLGNQRGLNNLPTLPQLGQAQGVGFGDVIPDQDHSSSSAVTNVGLDDPALLQRALMRPPPRLTRRSYTKVYKLGSITRAVDVNRFKNYMELRCGLAHMFNLEGQLDQKLGWQLCFTDNEDDLLLVGDDPWEEFVRNVRAIRILTPAEVFYYTNEEKWTAATYNSNGGGAPKLL